MDKKRMSKFENRVRAFIKHMNLCFEDTVDNYEDALQ